MTDAKITIIGGGIVGWAIAYELRDDDQVFLLEKNRYFPSDNQSSRSSGVIHAGIYYDPKNSPLKAELCVKGNQLLYEFCQRYDLPARKTGKLVVAVDEREDQALDELLIRAGENQVQGVKKISSRGIRDYEENVYGYSALWVPSSGIVEPIAVVKKLKHLSQLEGRLLLGTEVKEIRAGKDEFVVKAIILGQDEYEFSTKYLVNAAGLDSAEIALMTNPQFPWRIFPVRGEAAKFYQSNDRLKVSRNVYPAPKYYTKPDGTQHLTVGVHLTPTFTLDDRGDYKKEKGEFSLGKEVNVGPLNRKKGINKEDFSSDLADPEDFRQQIKKYFPHIEEQDLLLHQTGIQAVLANGPDFHIAKDERYQQMINLVGICSPGLTASLAIAQKVKKMLKKNDVDNK